MFLLVCGIFCVFFFKQKTAYEMRISDWSSDVCSSDLTTRDYLVNRQFRRDIYVKGKRQMTVAEIADRLDEYSFIALGNREELPLSLATSAGSATLDRKSTRLNSSH